NEKVDSAHTPAGVLLRAQGLAGLVEHRHYASPPDLLARYARTLWPEMRREVASPLVVDEGGSRSLREWDGCTDEGQLLINEGETYFQRGDMDGAAARYRRALERSPRCYTALMYLGDCAWKSGDPRTAVEIYDRGLALNRDD